MNRPTTLKRWQLLFFLLLAFGGIGTSIGLGVVVLQVANENTRTQARLAVVLRTLETNRVQSVADLCRRDNRDNLNNILFLQSLHSRPTTLRLARRAYKLTPDCMAYARAVVSPKPRDLPQPTRIPPNKP